MHQPEVTLRAASRSDAPLFYELMNSTMRQFIVRTWGSWDEERFQQLSVEVSSSPSAQVVLVGNVEAGVLHVDRLPTHFQVHQIYLWPQFQRQGIGAVLIDRLVSEASSSNVPIRLRVLLVNPVRGFYERLGFVVTKENSECFYMERAP